MRALIVDDDQVVLASCRKVLEAEDIEVETVSSVAQAVDTLERREFDFLLADVKMPVEDGFSLLVRIAGRWPRLPVVVMSGFSTDETVARGYELGAARFIAKPFVPDELVEVVRSLFGKEGEDERADHLGHR